MAIHVVKNIISDEVDSALIYICFFRLLLETLLFRPAKTQFLPLIILLATLPPMRFIKF